MEYITQYHKNMMFIKKNPYVGHFAQMEIRRLEVEETDSTWEVRMNDWKVVKLHKKGEFDYEELFKQNRKRVENLDKIYVLNVLHTLLRKSENCGYDNKVYLYYTNLPLFHAMAAVVDFKELLSDGQFMVVFKPCCLEDADIIEKVRVDIDLKEIQNIVFLYQPQSCGYEFFREIIRKSPYIVYADGWMMHRQLEETEKQLGARGLFSKYFLNETEYEFDLILEYMKIFDDKVDERFTEVSDQFEKMFRYKRKLSVSDIMKGLFIAKYYVQKHSCIDYGIVPVVVYFPDHYLRFMHCYDTILQQFKKVIFFRLVRNPVVRTIRAYKFIKDHQLHHFSKFINVLTEELVFDEYSLDHGKSFSVRFEDLKQNPGSVLPAICACIGIPFARCLMQDSYVFREDALYADLDRIFSDRDIGMLQLLYQDILQYYGYEPVCKLSGIGDVNRLLDYVFGFETELADLLGISPRFVRLAVKEALAKAVGKIGHIKFPEYLSV